MTGKTPEQTIMKQNTDNKKGGPLGQPDRQGRGDAQPAGAGDEGGMGFLGDQRGATEDPLPALEVDQEPGTPMTPVKKENAGAKERDKKDGRTT